MMNRDILAQANRELIKQQFFGIEIEFTGISRADAAAIMASHFGTRVRHCPYEGYDMRRVADRSGRDWKITRDVSIRATNRDDRKKCELVSPKLKYEDMDTLQEIVRKLKAAGGVVNDSCGIHVHVDAANHNVQTLKNMLYMMYSKEDVLFEALKVRPSGVDHYCKKEDPQVFEKVRKEKHLDMDKLKSIWYDGHDAYEAHQHYSDYRYFALNLHNLWYRSNSATVEFRLFNSTLNAGKVRAYVVLALAMSAAAINGKAVRAKKPDWSNNKRQNFEWWLMYLGLKDREGEFQNVRWYLIRDLEGTASIKGFNKYNRRAAEVAAA